MCVGVRFEAHGPGMATHICTFTFTMVWKICPSHINIKILTNMIRCSKR
jgi:hypothetical protein